MIRNKSELIGHFLYDLVFLFKISSNIPLFCLAQIIGGVMCAALNSLICFIAVRTIACSDQLALAAPALRGGVASGALIKLGAYQLLFAAFGGHCRAIKKLILREATLLDIYSEYLKIVVFVHQSNANVVDSIPTADSLGHGWYSMARFYREVVVRQLLLQYLFSVCIGTMLALAILSNTDEDERTSLILPIHGVHK
jgi:hypothetical protein